MGVDEVVVAGAVACPGLHHAVGEGAELGRELLLGEAFIGARVDVADEDAGGEVHGRGRAAAVERVKISTSMLMAARRCASSTM